MSNWLDKLIITGILKRIFRNLPENVNLKEVVMPPWANGFRTYALMGLTILYNILAANNILLPDVLSEKNAVVVVDFVLGILMVLTNYIGRKKIAASGKTMGY